MRIFGPAAFCLSLIWALVWAHAVSAFEFPRLEGAASEFLDDARKGDAYAAQNYVQPVLDGRIMTDAESAALMGWLDYTFDAFDRMGDDANAAWVANAAANHLWPRNENHAALGWASACVERVGQATERYARVIAAYCFENASIVAGQMERGDQAIAWAQEARYRFIKLYEEEPEDWIVGAVVSTLINEGTALDAAKRHDEAVRIYTQALDVISEHDGPESLMATYAILNIGVSYWYSGQFEAARDWKSRGLPLIEHYEGPFSSATTKTRINLGLIAYDLGNAEEAMNWAIAALPYIARYPRDSLGDQRWTFELLRRLFEDRGEIERAILFGKMAVNAQQEYRAINAGFSEADSESLRSEWSRLYKDLAELLIAEGRFSEAQAVLNMEKEQETFEFLKRDSGATLNETRAVLTDGELGEAERLSALAAEPVAAYELWKELDAEIGADGGTPEQEDRLFLLEDARAEAEAAFRASVDDFLTDVEERERAGFEAGFDATGTYQAILQEKERPTAILQLAVLDEATHLFLTLPGATVHETVEISRKDMRAAVFEALQAIERVDPDVQVPMQRLYDLLFAPVREALELSGTEVVMLNAGDVLRYVPFAALHDGEGYLVRDFAFAQYIAAVPTTFGRPERRADSAAGFGVTQAHGDFDALPGVGFEIETLFTADDGQGVLEGQALLDTAFDARALRRTLRRAPELLHIASHFALVPGQVDDSFLLLGDGSQLSLSELSTSKFNFAGVDLLTLSACQTARGGDGSEIDGVGAAALKNGASAVMASLWPVADAATPILMNDFYAGLYERGLDKAEALRRAQIAMLEGGDTTTVLAQRAAEALEPAAIPPQGFAHPYFWSAFIIMGNWL